MTSEHKQTESPATVALRDLQSRLLAAANYIDVLGGDSKSYRAALAATPALPATGDSSAGDLAQTLPDDWVPCTITYEGQYPEDVAYGPTIMMARLKKWLERYFALKAEVQDEPVAYLVLCSSFRASPDGQDAEGHEWLEEAGCDTPGAFPVYRLPQTNPTDALDAKRYRYLRDNCVREWISRLESTKGKKTLDIDFEADGHDLDAAIDAALAKHKEV
ncbi:hypothetical protein ACQYWY_21675 [Comamonas sediminis]|uniref:hypothetical protein n=1 Tax=Comamonas sediminis TaxID=1783360 RepID=UPI003D29A245